MSAKVNYEVKNRMMAAHGAEIKKLYWLATIEDMEELEEVLSEMTDDDWQNCFPDIYKSPFFSEYKEDAALIEEIYENANFGFLAEVQIPVCRDFTYREGEDKPCGWSASYGLCRLFYCYAETTEELIQKIEEKAAKVFQEFIDQDSLKKK